MKKTYFVSIATAFLILAISINCIVFTSFFLQIDAIRKIMLIIGMNMLLFLIFHLLIYKPYMKIKNAVKELSHSLDWSEFTLNTAAFFSPDLLSSVDKLKNQRLDFADAQKQAEYLALQNQINPHFLYNTLEALRGDTLYEGLTSVAAVIEALATFFRYMITDTGNLTSLENEIEHAKNYFLIQKYRFENKIDMKILLPENETKPLNYMIPKLTLQPIIENSIFHGLEKKSGIGCITIEIDTTSNFLFINISDTGVGIKPEILHQINQSFDESTAENTGDSFKGAHQSIALKNVSRRIKLLFGYEYGLHVYSTLNLGTDVRIILPKIKDKDLII